MHVSCLGWTIQIARRWQLHCDVMAWKHFPHCWRFVRGNPPQEEPVMRSFDDTLVAILYNLLKKQLGYWWFETPRWSCDVTVTANSSVMTSWCMLPARHEPRISDLFVCLNTCISKQIHLLCLRWVTKKCQYNPETERSSNWLCN